jgi:hypothetical protein
MLYHEFIPPIGKTVRRKTAELENTMMYFSFILNTDTGLHKVKFKDPYFKGKECSSVDLKTTHTGSFDNMLNKRGTLKFKEETPDRTLWRTRFRRGYGPVVRQTTE